MQINKMPNVTIYRDNRVSADDVLGFGAERVVLATGCHWRRDGYGRSNGGAIPGLDRAKVFTPDDIMRGVLPDGPVLLFDDDAFYIGTVLADVLRAAGREVIYVTADDTIASWSVNTHEYRHIQKRLREVDVRMVTGHNLLEADAEGVRLGCVYTDREQRVPCASILLITARLPNDGLQQALAARQHEWRDANVESVTAIGDCLAPGLIAHAVYAGHRYAQELDVPFEGEVRFRRVAERGPGYRPER
jgi:dimethylamine/trimethylamine dehydrogenase